MTFCLSFSWNSIDYFKRTLESDWLFCFTVPFSLAEKRMRFITKNGAIRKKIAPLRANQIARITSDFKMDLINSYTGLIWISFTTKSFLFERSSGWPRLLNIKISLIIKLLPLIEKGFRWKRIILFAVFFCGGRHSDLRTEKSRCDVRSQLWLVFFLQVFNEKRQEMFLCQLERVWLWGNFWEAYGFCSRS